MVTAWLICVGPELGSLSNYASVQCHFSVTCFPCGIASNSLKVSQSPLLNLGGTSYCARHVRLFPSFAVGPCAVHRSPPWLSVLAVRQSFLQMQCDMHGAHTMQRDFDWRHRHIEPSLPALIAASIHSCILSLHASRSAGCMRTCVEATDARTPSAFRPIATVEVVYLREIHAARVE